MTSHPAFTVIIPAHNEEAVIGRCLDTILRDAPAEHAMEIIVAANGCNDRTVELAQAASPSVRVLDLAQGSKTGAINAANDIASHFPRIYLDADVECSFVTLAALANALCEPGVMTAAPAIRMDVSRLSWLARAYYRVWLRQPYATAGKGGAGCYGLSRTAIETIGRFPPIIADDFWIHTRFPDSQKRYITSDAQGRPVFTVVHPPRTATEQVRVEARRQLGTVEVHRLHPSPYLAGYGVKGGLGAALRSGVSPIDLAIFSGVKLFARAAARLRKARGRTREWTRDLNSRQA
jgi:glycosyltransferase involved in cell wall biosynthesis